MKTLKLSLFALAGAFFMTTAANAQQKAVPAKAAKVETTTTKTAITPKAVAAPAAAAATPSGLTWKEESFNFGETLEKGKPVTHEFAFKNTSKQTVLLTNVKASCGCTATDYTKTPVKPGETGFVKATYNAANPGTFNKTITVTTNEGENTNKVLTIKGKVNAPATPAAAPATQQ